jgi:hypothetical protein
MRIGFRTLRHLIREALKDVSYLEKVTKRAKIKLFPADVMDFINTLPTRDVNFGRKAFIKWLALELRRPIFSSSGKEITPTTDDIDTIIDWINATGTDLEHLNFIGLYYAMQRSKEWRRRSEAFNERAGIVYTDPDGWKIWSVKPEELDEIGDRMGNCLWNDPHGYGGIITSRTGNIYVLLDPRSDLHLAFTVIDNRIIEIYGKANTSPKQAYFRRIIPWLKDRGIEYKHKLGHDWTS